MALKIEWCADHHAHKREKNQNRNLTFRNDCWKNRNSLPRFKLMVQRIRFLFLHHLGFGHCLPHRTKTERIWSRFDLRYIQKCVVIESENLLIGFIFCVVRILVHWMLRLRAYWIDAFFLFCFIPISVLFFFSFVFFPNSNSNYLRWIFLWFVSIETKKIK